MDTGLLGRKHWTLVVDGGQVASRWVSASFGRDQWRAPAKQSIRAGFCAAREPVFLPFALALLRNSRTSYA